MVAIMNITYETYREIVKNVPDIPPESGGILGEYNDVISCVVFDSGIQKDNWKPCCYTPDVKKLNICIEKWREQGIEFCGIFHTHFNGISTLSEGDKRYIRKIMFAMPSSKKKIYFPIVILPEREIKVYVCVNHQGKLYITEDGIRLV